MGYRKITTGGIILETNILERPGGKLAYSDYGGSGSLVLMLPGMGALRSEFRYLAPRLSQTGYRAVAADLRGHGDSSVPWDVYDVPSAGEDILALIEHLQAGPAHLVGNSFSAASAVWAAAERAELVRSLTLIGPFVRDARISPIMKALFWLMMNNPWRVSLWGKYYATLYPTQKPPDLSQYLDQLTENLAQPGRFEAAKALANSSRRPSDESLEQLKCSVLVIMGSKDPDFPDPQEEGRIVAERTGGVLEMVEGAGHYPQTEMPEKTFSIIMDFLDQVGSEYSGEKASVHLAA
jgi:pimeloyl-ACP methyl ester carboxylesterase